jgi:hypothetical protein
MFFASVQPGISSELVCYPNRAGRALTRVNFLGLMVRLALMRRERLSKDNADREAGWEPPVSGGPWQNGTNW